MRSPSEPVSLAQDVLPALAAHSPNDPEDRTDLRLPLPKPCAPGDTLIFQVAFTSTLPTIVERTGYLGSFHMVGQWFPKPARLRQDGTWSHFPFLRLSEFDADFGSYDVTLEVPPGFLVGATGRQVEDREEGGWRRVRYLQEEVHDFAWTAWDHFQERQASIEGVQVRLLYPEGHEPSVTRQLDGLRVALRCMTRRLGSYPYPTLTVVQPPSGAEEAGGMEYPTLITTGGPWYGPPMLRTSEAVTIHEFGHQYFYGMVASDEHRHPFLDEGLNTLVEGLCLREGYGHGSLLAVPGLSVDFLAGARWIGLGAGHDHAIAHSAASFPTADHYSRLVYFRAAILLATVRNTFGEALFDEALSNYVRTQRFLHPEPPDLLATFARVEPAMAAALEEGLLRRGWIDMTVVALQPTWTVIARRGTIRLPTEVCLHFADGSQRIEHWNGEADWIRFDIEGPPELLSVKVDPERKILLDEDWSNNARSLQPAALGFGTLERAAFWGGLLGHLLAP
ncbi:MAG: M1 family metallopeptidase [Myxococcales bacterium]|nr:M1 family metallopeptidase [Polyangiaceae bacterium]MDW8250943.1 M1 family metallopeptidase [Myxococcales bacterium]